MRDVAEEILMGNRRHHDATRHAWRVSFAAFLYLSGCSVRVEPLMPTPILYEVNGIGPLDRVPADEHWNLRRVYYATSRTRTDDP